MERTAAVASQGTSSSLFFLSFPLSLPPSFQQLPAQSSKAQSSPFGIGSSHSYQADPSSYSPLSSPATSSPSGNAYSNLANRSTAFGETSVPLVSNSFAIPAAPGQTRHLSSEHTHFDAYLFAHTLAQVKSPSRFLPSGQISVISLACLSLFFLF